MDFFSPNTTNLHRYISVMNQGCQRTFQTSSGALMLAKFVTCFYIILHIMHMLVKTTQTAQSVFKALHTFTLIEYKVGLLVWLVDMRITNPRGSHSLH